MWRCSGTVLKPRYFSPIVFPTFLVLPVGKVLCFGHFGSPLYWNPNESFSMIRIQNPLIHLQVFNMFSDWDTVPPFVLHSCLLRENSFCYKWSKLHTLKLYQDLINKLFTWTTSIPIFNKQKVLNTDGYWSMTK